MRPNERSYSAEIALSQLSCPALAPPTMWLRPHTAAPPSTHPRAHLLVWVHIDVALDALLPHVGPGVPAHPFSLALGTLVLAEAALFALVWRQTLAFGACLEDRKQTQWAGIRQTSLICLWGTRVGRHLLVQLREHQVPLPGLGTPTPLLQPEGRGDIFRDRQTYPMMQVSSAVTGTCTQ